MYKRCEDCRYCTYTCFSGYYCNKKLVEVDPDDSCMYFEEVSESHSNSDSDDFDIFGILFTCVYFYFLGLSLLQIVKRVILPLILPWVLPTALFALVLYLMYKIVRKT